MKYCTKCKVPKEEELFYKNYSQCKECYKQYYLNNKTKINKAKNIAIRKSPELRAKEYINYRKYRIKNREKCMLNSLKARCKSNGIEFNLDITDIVIPDICPLLGIRITKEIMSRHSPYGPSVDRIEPTKGYTKGNVKVISYKANLMKNNASEEELLAFASNITTYLQK